MSRFLKRSGLVGVVLCLFLTGCGEELWTMTPEEEELIVAYAAGAVAKNNKYQTQGLIYYEEEPEPEPEDPDEVSGPGEDEPGEAQAPDGEDPGAQNPPEDGTADPGQDGPAASTATLAEAAGLAPVVAEYQGYQLADSYMEGSYFALNAQAGYQFLIMSIMLSNPSQEPVECNNLARGIRCTLFVNGEKQAEAMPTILLNDFATYLNTLEPGAFQETILIFEVPIEAAGEIQTLAMEFEADGVVYHVDLQ